MSTHFIDALDTALQRQANESTETILADYPQQAQALQPLLTAAQKLNTARSVIMPDDTALAEDRELFLSQMESLLPAPVSIGPLTRLKGWMVHQLPWLRSNSKLQDKEPKPMNALLIKAALVFTMIFGSVGGTAVLAAESLPNSPIYPIKLAMEDARLAMVQDSSADEAALNIALAEERATEITALVQEGVVPDTATQTRLEQHINAALNIAAQQSDETMRTLLTKAQVMVQTQNQNMADAETSVSEPAQQMLGAVGGFLNRAGQEIEEGLQNPQLFRSRYGNIPEGVVPQENGPGDGTCEGEDCEPVGDQNQFGLDPDNDGHNGPGDGTCEGEDCSQYQHQNEGMFLEPPRYQYHTNLGEGDGECNNGGCVPGGNDVHNGDGQNGDGNNGDGNNGDGNNGGGNGDGNNGDGNNGGSGGNGGGNGGGGGGGGG